MNNRKNENLDELLKQFFGGEVAKKTAENITKGEQILRENPAPLPDEEAITLIKVKVAKAIAANRARALRRTFYRVAAIAAVIMIAFVSVTLLEHKASESVKVATTAKVTQGTTENDEFFNSDAELETLKAEVEQVGDEIATLEWEKTSDSVDADLIDVEMDLMDIDSDFWKG